MDISSRMKDAAVSVPPQSRDSPLHRLVISFCWSQISSSVLISDWRLGAEVYSSINYAEMERLADQIEARRFSFIQDFESREIYHSSIEVHLWLCCLRMFIIQLIISFHLPKINWSSETSKFRHFCGQRSFQQSRLPKLFLALASTITADIVAQLNTSHFASSLSSQLDSSHRVQIKAHC